ncbi:TetR/AcrR family transcriptional regulator C-terminal domain-containing protein [Vitiosangium sp. GDMCC 1.1324]|uniref:TetR/AcrR family transcriptional regulator C-terminal domain-containing protein n=1 Tax=Vitiosangium sp. (strain GDMCC 1.1324) TaxID=2138576 RepID=UPI000D3DB8E4|nr:TetR/AcrR family transcriptional regulator C-terminal domain-containing protein [Vitiosangium sp. GDMCC 1.1324]PTL77682.1 TetR family transcriptional regulator [Vitiosangium sp. GDMCC 1.1324]
MGLDRELVVRTALRVLNEEGLEGLTLRRIARELDVQAPALYWHFKNKQELVDEMATTMLRDLMGTAKPDARQSWVEFMAEMARGLRRMLLSYRDGAKVFSGTRLTDDTLYASMDVALRKLVDAGFSLRDAVCGFSTVSNYTVGFAIEEQAVHPLPGQHNEQYDLNRRSKRIDGKRFPLALAAGEEIFTEFDDRFERGLRLILSGMEQLLPKGR